MPTGRIETGNVEALARAAERSPLSPELGEYLDSLDLDREDRDAVVKFMDGMRFGGDGVKALPKVPPQITSHGWY